MCKVATFSIGLAIATGISADLAFADTSVAGVESQYSCADATKLKFDQKAYEAKTPTDQRIIDAQYQQCKIQQEADAKGQKPSERVVIVANPTPTSDHDRVFYGTIKNEDLDNAEKNCKGGGMAGGIVLSVVGTAAGMPGAAQAGGMIYRFSDVTCKGISDAIRGNNLMVVLAPDHIVASAVGGKILNEVVAKIPLVSDADKKNIQETIESATQPPSVKVEKDKVHIDVGPGGGIGIKKPW